MKKGLYLLCFLLPVCTYAQVGTFFQKAKKATPRTASATRSSNVQAALHRQLLHYLTAPEHNPSLSLQLKREKITIPGALSPLYVHYKQTLAAFQQFKADSAPLLYYQTIPQETRALSEPESNYWASRTKDLYNQVQILNQQIEADPALQKARDYLRHALRIIRPDLLSNLEESPTFSSTPIDIADFCLYPNPDTPLENPELDLSGKNFVIINDNVSILDFFKKLFNFGVLFPHANLVEKENATQFLQWIQETPQLPDIIFTDIILGDQTGYHIVQALRQRGYTGSIIALTSYKETPANARYFATHGFDGFISLHSITLTSPVQRLNQAAQLCFQRKRMQANTQNP